MIAAACKETLGKEARVPFGVSRVMSPRPSGSDEDVVPHEDVNVSV